MNFSFNQCALGAVPSKGKRRAASDDEEIQVENQATIVHAKSHESTKKRRKFLPPPTGSVVIDIDDDPCGSGQASSSTGPQHTARAIFSPPLSNAGTDRLEPTTALPSLPTSLPLSDKDANISECTTGTLKTTDSENTRSVLPSDATQIPSSSAIIPIAPIAPIIAPVAPIAPIISPIAPIAPTAPTAPTAPLVPIASVVPLNSGHQVIGLSGCLGMD
jgi:hypothetical protein